MAVELAVEAFKDEVQDANVWIFIDNTVDCYAFVRGNHKDKAVAKLIKRVILDLRRRNCWMFIDYV